MTGDHRWQGYTHAELYEQIHSGPGPNGSDQSARRWAELVTTLNAIEGDLHGSLEGSRGAWDGAAAESARTGLGPLRQWAADAQAEAEIMRQSAETQADYISKARNDMPPPQRVTAEEPSDLRTGLTHLFGGQTDYEIQEAQANAAEQKAFDVMAEYQDNTQGNTATLGKFAAPPQVVVDVPMPPSKPISSGRGGRSVIPGPRIGSPSVSGGGSGSRPPRPAGKSRIGAVKPEATAPTEETAGRPAGAPRVVSASDATSSATPSEERSTSATGTAAPGGSARVGAKTPARRSAAGPEQCPEQPAAGHFLLECADLFGEPHLVAPPVLGGDDHR
jgi:PPE family